VKENWKVPFKGWNRLEIAKNICSI